MAAGEFSQVQSKLSRYVGSKAKGAIGAKAIMSLRNSNVAEPIEPIRVMKKVISDGLETEEDSSVPVKSVISIKIESEKYLIIWKSWNLKNESWMETNGMIFNLVLQHVPEVLESLLKSQLKWDRVSGEMGGIGLLLMLRDITHKHDSSVQSTLSYVKTFFEWTLTFQCKHESNTDYYTLLLSRIETIRLHGGEPGFHNGVYQKHLSKLLEKQNMTALELIAIER